MKDKLLQIWQFIRKNITHNFWLKILSLLIALMLWNFVISSDTTRTRNKSIGGLTAYISGQTTLEANKLALAEDVSAALNGITVIVEVSQSEYVQVSADNVQVSLDLSSVRAAGNQQVRLRATTAYGKVAQIIPSTVTLDFETLDSRSVPVNIKLTGDMSDNYYYNHTRVNPASITVSGAASVVQSISAAYVYDDMTGHDTSFTSALPFVLQDSSGNEVGQSLLNLSSSSATVNVEIYPSMEVKVRSALEDIITGKPADGYVVESVSVQPETVTIAGDAETLETLTSLWFEPISVDGATRSFSARAKLSGLLNVKYMSAEQVYVSIVIAEETVTEQIDNVRISYVGQDERFTLYAESVPASVRVTGAKSLVETLKANGMDAVCDLTGLTEGTHTVSVRYAQQYDESLTFEPSEGTVSVKLVPISEEE